MTCTETKRAFTYGQEITAISATNEDAAFPDSNALLLVRTLVFKSTAVGSVLTLTVNSGTGTRVLILDNHNLTGADTATLDYNAPGPVSVPIVITPGKIAQEIPTLSAHVGPVTLTITRAAGVIQIGVLAVAFLWDLRNLTELDRARSIQNRDILQESLGGSRKSDHLSTRQSWRETVPGLNSTQTPDFLAFMAWTLGRVRPFWYHEDFQGDPENFQQVRFMANPTFRDVEGTFTDLQFFMEEEK